LVGLIANEHWSRADNIDQFARVEGDNHFAFTAVSWSEFLHVADHLSHFDITVFDGLWSDKSWTFEAEFTIGQAHRQRVQEAEGYETVLTNLGCASDLSKFIPIDFNRIISKKPSQILKQ